MFISSRNIATHKKIHIDFVIDISIVIVLSTILGLLTLALNAKSPVDPNNYSSTLNFILSMSFIFIIFNQTVYRLHNWFVRRFFNESEINFPK